MDVVADTSLVIALEREAKGSGDGPGHHFLAGHPADRFYLTFTVTGELASGESARAVEDWQALCAPYTVLPWIDEVSMLYGRVFRTLRKAGTMIGTNDLWIAATALAYRMPVATANYSEFERVPELTVLRVESR